MDTMERQNVNPGAGEGYPDNERGKNAAVTSMVLGIVAVVLWFFGFAAVVSVVLGIIGLVYANKAKTEGFRGGFYTAGFVLSLIGLIGGDRRYREHYRHRAYQLCGNGGGRTGTLHDGHLRREPYILLLIYYKTICTAAGAVFNSTGGLFLCETTSF